MRPDVAIAAAGLGRSFARRDGTEVTALAGLDLTVERGEVVGLLGHNGAGKTTTLRLLTGVLRPSRGSLAVLGLDPVHDGASLRDRVGVLTETAAVDPRLTGRENLASYGEMYGLERERAQARASELLDRFGLAGRGDDRAGGYSKGMRRRLALARSLLHDPELLLLDEPTADLDPIARRDVHALVRDLASQGRTLLLCTHDLAEAQELCDHVAVLRHGSRVAWGTPAALSARWGAQLRLRIDLDDADRERVRGVLGDDRSVRSVPGGVELDPVARDEIPTLTAALAAAGVPLYGVIPLPPSLEEAYVALHDAPSAVDSGVEPADTGVDPNRSGRGAGHAIDDEAGPSEGAAGDAAGAVSRRPEGRA